MINVMPNVTIEIGERRGAYKNMMVQGGLDWVLDLIAAVPVDQVTHVAVGDDPTAVSLGDLSLRNERVRKAVTAISRDSGATIIEGFFSETEANFTWREIGLIAGGTDALRTGLLLARAVITEQKDNKRTATVTWEIGIKNS